MTQERIHAFLKLLDLPAQARSELLKLTPSDYVGTAATLAEFELTQP
jgi:hypothetical protein